MTFILRPIWLGADLTWGRFELRPIWLEIYNSIMLRIIEVAMNEQYM